MLNQHAKLHGAWDELNDHWITLQIISLGCQFYAIYYPVDGNTCYIELYAWQLLHLSRKYGLCNGNWTDTIWPSFLGQCSLDQVGLVKCVLWKMLALIVSSQNIHVQVHGMWWMRKGRHYICEWYDTFEFFTKYKLKLSDKKNRQWTSKRV